MTLREPVVAHILISTNHINSLRYPFYLHGLFTSLRISYGFIFKSLSHNKKPLFLLDFAVPFN